MSDIRQILEGKITIYNGKVRVSDTGFGYVLRFNLTDGSYAELCCRLVKEGQKTISTIKPRIVTIKSYQEIEDINYTIGLPI